VDKNIQDIINKLKEFEKSIKEVVTVKLNESVIIKNLSDSVNYFKEQILSGERPFISISENSNGFVISDGNHRFQAYKELGFKKIPIRDYTGGKVLKKELLDIWNNSKLK